MTLQQLRYVVEVALRGSISAAASRLFIAQPSLSKAIHELERELGITIFKRSPHGVELTEEGDRFLAYARQVVDQVDLLEAHYVGSEGPRASFCLSCPHEAQLTELFAETLASCEADAFEFSLREVPASVVIEDVRQQMSELGIIYLSGHNRDALTVAIRSAKLHYAVITEARPYILVRENSPFAQLGEVEPDDLSSLTRVMLGWVSFTHTGMGGLLVKLPSASKVVRTTDRETQKRLVRYFDGYMMQLAIRRPETTSGGLVALPLAGAEPVEVGLLTRPGIPLSPHARKLRQKLRGLSMP